jgi:hypothetical protein
LYGTSAPSQETHPSESDELLQSDTGADPIDSRGGGVSAATGTYGDWTDRPGARYDLTKREWQLLSSREKEAAVREWQADHGGTCADTNPAEIVAAAERYVSETADPTNMTYHIATYCE